MVFCLSKIKRFINIPVLLFIVALITGLFFHLYKIETVPYGINHDGAWSGIWAIELSQKPWPIQVYSDQGWLGEAMPRYVIALFIKILGPTMLALKLGMMIFAIIALPFFYLLVNQLFQNKRLAFFSTFLLGVSGWDITYGKTGWRTSAVSLFVILTTLFLLKALQSGKKRFFALCGIFMALTLNTYNAGQFIPFTVFGVLTGYLVYRTKKWKKMILNYAILIIFFIVFVAPLVWYVLHHWENYTGRARFLSVFGKIQREKSLYPAWENIKYAAFMYTYKGHFGADFYLKEPLLDFPTNLLFLIGLGLSLLQIKKKKYLFLLFLFLTSLIPSLLGNPDGGHAIGTIPSVYIFAGLGLESIYILLAKNKISKCFYLPHFVTLGFLVYAAVNTYNLYLGPHRYQRWGFYPETTAVAYFMKPKISKYDIYLTDNFPRDALTYLTYQGGDPWKKHYTWVENGNLFFNVSPSHDKGLIFIMYQYPNNLTLIEKLKQKYTHGELSEVRYTDNSISKPAAWVFTVESSDITTEK